MMHSRTYRTEHEIVVAAPAEHLFPMIADVSRWPLIFPPTVHAERVSGGPTDERIRIWATANDEVKTWTSHRVLDPGRGSVAFRQERSQPPVAGMGGEWLLEAAGPDRTRVRLLHNYQVVDDLAEHVAWVETAVDRNSKAELSALREVAELTARHDELLLSFSDTVHTDGNPEDVYEFLDRADRWPDRLPHVSRAELSVCASGAQVLEMDTRTPDGSVHTTCSVRVELGNGHMVYKQTRTPALMTSHLGYWRVSSAAGRTEIVGGHTVLLNRAAVNTVLGAHATVAEARAFVRGALSRNSSTTMRHAAAYAEQLPTR